MLLTKAYMAETLSYQLLIYSAMSLLTIYLTILNNVTMSLYDIVVQSLPYMCFACKVPMQSSFSATALASTTSHHARHECAQPLCTSLMLPLCCLQIQVENDVSRKRFNGVLPTLRYIWHNEGFIGYFKVSKMVGRVAGMIDDGWGNRWGM